MTFSPPSWPESNEVLDVQFDFGFELDELLFLVPEDPLATPPSVVSRASAEGAAATAATAACELRAPPHAPTLTIENDPGFRAFLVQHGLAEPEPAAPPPPVVERTRNFGVQTVDPRVIAPLDYITYRQSFDTLVAANFMGLLVRASTSMTATAIADRTGILLGLRASDQPSWDALYRMAVTALVVERQLQARLAELLAASTIDPTGSVALASVLVEMRARQRRPWVIDNLPQPGDNLTPAIMPPGDNIEY
jgi:hypothetical protein